MSGYTAAVWVVCSYFVLESYGLTIIDTITPSCTVKTSDGTVDLSSIATAGGNTDPSFDVDEDFGAVKWNPCNDFTVPGATPMNSCAGELIIQSTGILQCTAFGSKSSSAFSVQNNQLVLNYNNPQQGTSSVTLTCDPNGSGKGTFSSNGDTNSFIYKGKAACPGGGGLTIVETIKPSCIVKTSDGIVDLSSVATAGGDADAAFEVDENFGAVKWNPCNDFTVPGATPMNSCTGQLIIQSTGILKCAVLGFKSVSSFTVQNNHLVLNYNDPQQGNSSVTLSCDPNGSGNGTFSSNGALNSFIYKGKAACPGGGGLTIVDTIKPSCIVKTSDGIVDLSSVATAGGDADPAFEVDEDFGAVKWNPCNDFNVPGATPMNSCTGELIIQSTGILKCAVLGFKSASSFTVQNNQIVLNYNDPQQGNSSVTLTCDLSGSGKGTFSSNGDLNLFIYKGKAACPGGGGSSVSSGLNEESVHLLI